MFIATLIIKLCFVILLWDLQASFGKMRRVVSTVGTVKFNKHSSHFHKSSLWQSCTICFPPLRLSLPTVQHAKEASVILCSTVYASDSIYELCQYNVKLWINIYHHDDIANLSLGMSQNRNQCCSLKKEGVIFLFIFLFFSNRESWIIAV